MKNLLNAALVALSVTMLLSGCTKGDILSENSLSATIANDATSPVLSRCKIRRIYQGPDDYPYAYTGLFSYNKAGNPYSILRSPGGGGSDYYFVYDSQNRLKELKEFSYGLVWRHYYRHNALGQIMIDSAIYPGSDGRDTTIYVSTIEYDPKGRVVKETIVNTRNDGFPLDRTRRPTYTYDNRGNLGVNGWKSSSYDYKVNPLRLSPVLQFIMRNYSMNNAAVQPRYNSIGLPMSLSSTNDPFFGWLSAGKIIYECQ